MSWMLTLPCNYNKKANAYIARVMRVQNMTENLMLMLFTELLEQNIKK